MKYNNKITLQFVCEYAKINKSNWNGGNRKWDFLKGIVTVIYVIVCLVLIVICLMQSKDDEGASGTIVGGSSSSFYEKNKGKTKEGMLKRWTIILGITFAVLSIVLGTLLLV